MMRQYELVERVARYNPDCDEALLNRAYVYAMQKHGAQTRASGDPYFSHPLEVAAILTDMRLDDATIAVALLHDTIEDTDATRTEIDQLFGHRIGGLVDGLTKIKRLDFATKRAKQAENFRKLLLAVAEDVRVLLVKLADRLHNMRTLHFVKQEKRGRVAEETMEIYAPLAGRMGMHDVREELERLAFKTLNPEAHEAISERLDDLRIRNADLISDIESDLTRRLAERGIDAKVIGRQKQPYSIFRKMQRKSVAFEQLSDIYGFRVIVDSVDNCYLALGLIHSTWPAVPGRYKDYISTPKQNDYRSVHTTVVGPSRQRVELQIRTREMDQIAEYGIAAHALYRDGRPGNGTMADLSKESRSYAWLRRTIESLSEGDSSVDFLENTKLELFHDQVFCFTPKGRLIALPVGATPIDFAYAVHTDIGNACMGCKINGYPMPLRTKLKNGDEVEIQTEEGHVPPAAWEALAVTGKARAAIRRAARDAARRQFEAVGRHLLEHALHVMDGAPSDDDMELALSRLGQKSLVDFYIALGRGELPIEDAVRAVVPGAEYSPSNGAQPGDGWFGLATAEGMVFKVPDHPVDYAGKTLPVRGLSGNLPVKFAPNGGALPGDRIVGILSPGEGITIYPIQSSALAEFDDRADLWLDVRWDETGLSGVRFPAQIIVTIVNKPGALAQIAQVVGENRGNIDNIKMTRRSTDFHEMLVDLEVFDVKHLNRIIEQIRAKDVVSDVHRVIS
ncbi:MAG: bifunctional (p)ppGpp synthetase/guanosine-3',5'-bis(diphosphate) 3'-pyrophosphohydrolase [Pseudomonadota bacterium]